MARTSSLEDCHSRATRDPIDHHADLGSTPVDASPPCACINGYLPYTATLSVRF